MGIIYHQSKFIRHFDHLRAPLYLGLFQRFYDIILRRLKMTADRYGRQGIIYTESSRNINLHRKIHQSFHLIGHSQITRPGNHAGVPGPQICLGRKAEGFQRTGMTGNDLIQMGIIRIYDTDPALSEQSAFTFQIFLKAGMLIGTDMIRFDVGKDTDLESNTGCPMQF